MSEDSLLSEFVTDTKSFLKAPITIEDLGRYKCIAANNFGYRTLDAILSKHNDQMEFLVYGFVDKQSDHWYENTHAKLLKSVFKPSNLGKFLEHKIMNQIKPVESDLEDNKQYLDEIPSVELILISPRKTFIQIGDRVELKCTTTFNKPNCIIKKVYK